MKRILLILLLVSTYVLSFGQTKPNTFVEETSPTNSNFEVYSQKNDLPRRASLNNLKEFFDQYIYTKTDSICISRQAGDTCVYFVPTDIDSLGMSNDTIIIYSGTDEIADLPVSRLEAVIEIGSSNITDGDIATADLADGSINSAKISDGSITSGDILDATISTDDLANLAVTLAKIAANAIDSTKVINGGLSGSDLADAAILTAKIADAQITNAKIVDNTINLGKIQQINSERLLGRYSSGIGDVEQLTIGSGLSIVGTALTATASSDVVDSMRIDRSGSTVTVNLYSGTTLVAAKSFTDSTAVGALDDLTDVSITSPGDNSSLVYDSDSSKWIDKVSYPVLREGGDFTFVSGITLESYTAWQYDDDPSPGDALQSYVKDSNGNYTFTIEDEAVWRSIRISGTSSHLDGSGDLNITLVSRNATSATDNYIDLPDLFSNGQAITDWDAYGITCSYTVSATGTVVYTFSNLGGFGATGFVLKFDF